MAIEPRDIFIAAINLSGKLSELLPDEQQLTVSGFLNEIIDELVEERDYQKQEACALKLVRSLSVYNSLLAHLKLELEQVRTQREEIIRICKNRMNQFQLDEQELESSVLLSLLLSYHSGSTRTVYFSNAPGRTIANTKKLRNIKFNLKTIIPAITTILPIFTDANPIVTVFAALAFAVGIANEMNIELTDKEASVYWGCVLSRDGSEESIMFQTNEYRTKNNFPSLTLGEICSALQKLTDLKCVELLEGRWRLTESYQILES